MPVSPEQLTCCAWCGVEPYYIAYQDTEWGAPTTTSTPSVSLVTTRPMSQLVYAAASFEQITVGIDHNAQNYSRESDLAAANGGRIIEGVVNEIHGIADMKISVALREEASVRTQIAQNVEHIAQMAE